MIRRFCGVALLLAGCAAVAQSPKVSDGRGAVYAWEQPPQRIVSLVPSLTESVCALGACGALVGVDRFSNEPASVQALPKLGGLDDARVEAIAVLRPDLVLAAPSARVVERLRGLGIRVMVFDTQSHADVQRVLKSLAEVLGVPGRDRQVWAGVEQALADAAARVPQVWRGGRVYFEVEATPYAAGAGSFIGETLSRLGLDNIVPASMGPFPRLNAEFVVRAQPLIVMASRANLSAMPARPGWSALLALRDGRACGFAEAPYELLVRPGPRVGEGAALIVDCLVRLEAGK